MYKNRISGHEKAVLVVYLILFAAVALTVALMQATYIDPPLFTSPPDETARYLVPRYIFEHGSLPTGLEAESRHEVYGEFSYAYLPGLSYIVMGWVMRLFNSGISPDAYINFVTARCVNVVFGLITAVFIWLLGRRIFNKERYVWLFAFAVMFLPQHLFIHTYVNTESLCMLSIAVIYHSLMRMLQDKPDIKSLIEFAVGASILTLSYYNAYGVLLASVPIFISLYVNKDDDGKLRVDYKQMFAQGGIIILIWCVLSLWWFIRQGILFDGDFLGMKIRNSTLDAVGQNILRDKGYTFIGMIREFKPFNSAFVNFVATYGSCSILGNILIYRLYKAVYIIGVILVIAAVIYMCVKHKKIAYTVYFHAMLLIGDLITVGLWLYYCYCRDYQPQGRYVFPALFHIYWLLIKGYEFGIEKIPGKERNKTIICGCGCIFVCMLLLWYVCGYAVPAYRAGA